MKIRIGKALSAVVRVAAPVVVPVAVSWAAGKVVKLGDKALTKAARPKA